MSSHDLYGRDLKRRKRDAGNPISSSSFLSLKAELARHHTSAATSSKGTDGQSGGGQAGTDQGDEYSLPSKRAKPRSEGAVESSLLSSDAFQSRSQRKLPKHLLPSTQSDHSSPPKSSTKKSIISKGGTNTLSTWSSTPSAQLERDRNLILERKARLYDQLKKGLSGGVSLEDLQADGKLGGLIDWEKKLEEVEEAVDQDKRGDGSQSSHEDDNDLTQVGEEGEEMVEYEDEFGRSRVVPRSQVPLAYLIQLKKREEGAENTDSPPVLRGPQHHFPILTTSSSLPARTSMESKTPPEEIHFDSNAEVRNRGAGFYRFTAGNEEERQRQMRELMKERERTLKERERRAEGGGDQGKEDVMAGGLETDDTADDNTSTSPLRTMTKGEKRLEERRKLIEERRREMAAARSTTGETSEGQPALMADIGTHHLSPTPVDRGQVEKPDDRQKRAIDRFLDDLDVEYRNRKS